MVKVAATVFALLALFGPTSACLGQDAKLPKAMLGHWKCNPDKTIKLMKESGATDERIDMAKQMLDGMKMEFTQDNLIVSVMGQEIKATYSVEDSNVGKKWIKLSVEAPERPQARNFEFTMDDDDSFVVKMQGQNMAFDRDKKKGSKE